MIFNVMNSHPVSGCEIDKAIQLNCFLNSQRNAYSGDDFFTLLGQLTVPSVKRPKSMLWGPGGSGCSQELS